MTESVHMALARPYLLTSSDWRHRPASTQPALKAAHMKATSHAPRSLRYDSQNNKGGKFMMGNLTMTRCRVKVNSFGHMVRVMRETGSIIKFMERES